MIRYATLHKMGMQRGRGVPRFWDSPSSRKNWYLKYFDPADPLENLLAEFVGSSKKPDIPADTCLIKSEDAQLYQWTLERTTVDMLASCEALMLEDEQGLYPFVDMWSDAGYMDQPLFGEPIDHRKLLLFVFWNKRKIGFNQRLFKECYPPFKPRPSTRDETP